MFSVRWGKQRRTGVAWEKGWRHVLTTEGYVDLGIHAWVGQIIRSPEEASLAFGLCHYVISRSGQPFLLHNSRQQAPRFSVPFAKSFRILFSLEGPPVGSSIIERVHAERRGESTP